MADLQSLCKVPRGLVVGELDENLLCGICDGLLRKPRHSLSCDHTFCCECYEEALTKEACCPTCQKPVDASLPLQSFKLFEDIVSKTMIKCPNSAFERVGSGVNISQEPSKPRRTSASPAPSLDSMHSPQVDKEADDLVRGGSAPPRARIVGRSEGFSSPFDGFQVDTLPLSTSWGTWESPLPSQLGLRVEGRGFQQSPLALSHPLFVAAAHRSGHPGSRYFRPHV